MSINSDDKKVRYKFDCYILNTVLLVIILQIDNYYYLLSLCKTRSKEKGIDALIIKNEKINEFKKVRIKNLTCYYFDDIIKLEDFDIDNILIGPKPLHIRFDEINRFTRIYDGTRYLELFGPEKYDAIGRSTLVGQCPITLVRQSVRPSVRLSVTKFSQEWIITFF